MHYSMYVSCSNNSHHLQNYNSFFNKWIYPPYYTKVSGIMKDNKDNSFIKFYRVNWVTLGSQIEYQIEYFKKPALLRLLQQQLSVIKTKNNRIAKIKSGSTLFVKNA